MDSVVIFNPSAGRNQAWRRLHSKRSLLPDRIDVLKTKHPHHAEQLALESAHRGRNLIIAAGGDGTIHEVANGLLRSQRTDVTLGVLPIGSANDYAFSLAKKPMGVTFAVDVGRIEEPGGKIRHFLCCLGLGLNGAVTMEARRIRTLQGVALYGTATLKALRHHFRSPEMRIRIRGETQTLPTLMMSLMIAHREGGFVMAPNAVLDDGLFDYVHAGSLSRWQIMRLLPGLALWGAPKSFPHVRQGRCPTVHLTSSDPLLVHIDGEFFAVPDENIREFSAEILPKRLNVQLFDHPKK